MDVLGEEVPHPEIVQVYTGVDGDSPILGLGIDPKRGDPAGASMGSRTSESSETRLAKGDAVRVTVG